MDRVPPEIVQVRLMPKQLEFVMSDANQILYSGAVRAGKSRGLCYRAVRKASQSPKARVGLCRKTLVALKATTLRTLLEPDGDLPAVLPEGTYHHSLSAGKERITLNGGGEIVYFGCDNPEKIASMTLSEVLIDEGIELDEPEWNMLVTRCSLSFTLPDGSKNIRSMATATNPGAPAHFLHRLFFEEKFPSDKRHLIMTSSLENWHLEASYIEDNLAHLPGVARKRYLLGIWAAFEGAVYPQFSPAIHVFHDPGPWDYYLAGVDCGFRNRTTVRVFGVQRKGREKPRYHVIAEYYDRGVTRTELVQICAEADVRYTAMTFVVDKAAPDVVQDLKNHGMTAKPSNSERQPGYRTVSAALTDICDGHPRLSFEPGLKGTDEYMSYSWKPDAVNEDVIKRNDDAVDADRYAAMEIEAGARIGRLVPLAACPSGVQSQRMPVPAGCPDVDYADPDHPRWWSG